jgi:hypothetical protein
VFGYAPYYIGVYGQGGTGGVGDYGGFFYGYDGVRGYTSQTSGYGVWGTAYGSYGTGVTGYNPYAVGVRGIGGSGSGDWGGIFSGCNGVYGYSTCSYGRGAYGYAGGYAGDGVYGYASASYGQGVYGYTPGYAGDGVYGGASASYGYGVYGYASGSWGRGVNGYTSGYVGDAVRGYASGTYGYGGYFYSYRSTGVYADGSYWDGFFPDRIYAGGTVVSALGMSFVALNDGSEALEPGDLVAFSGFDASAEGSSGPTLAVQKANDANGGAIIGVVQSAYVKEAPVERQSRPTADPAPAAAEVDTAASQREDVPLPDQSREEAGEDTPPPLPQPPEGAIEIAPEAVPDVPTPPVEEAESLGRAEVGHAVEGSAKPGQYVVIVVQGITRVKVDASAAPVRAGDMLVASAAGFATAQLDVATARSREGVAERGISQGLVLGRALESLESGTGTIYVFVSVH